MFQSLGLLVLVSLSVAVELQHGTVSPPENLSILWISDFDQELSWAPPQNLTNCTPEYVAIAQPREYKEMQRRQDMENKQQFSIVMDGGFLHFSVKTLCGYGKESDPVFLNITYPELVRNVHCYIRSSSKAKCSWQLASHPPNLRFFYRLIDESGKLADKTPKDLQECPSYSYTDGNRTGCDLQMDMGHAIVMVFKGTLNNTLVRNTFKARSLEVRLPPLNWTVITAGDKFNISWIPPFSELDKWTFTIKYTECNKHKSEVIYGKTSIQLDRVAHCQYQMTIKAEHEYRAGGTEESKKKYFGMVIPARNFGF